MKKQKIIKLSVLSLVSCCLSYGKTLTTLPNFIIILADDLGYGDLSCYGHPTILTPNIDQLANEGMRFTQFYAGAAVSSPSRAALLTGRLAKNTGVYSTKDPLGNKEVVFLQNSAGGLPLSEITIAEILKNRGYRTGIIGKWHLGHMPEYLPVNQGFDYWFGIDHHQNGPVKVHSIATDIDKPHDINTSKRPWCSLYRNDTIIEENPNMLYFTKRFTDEAVNFITKNKETPFFLYYATNAPHTPLYATESFIGKSKRGIYGDMLEELDWSIGKIVETLKKFEIDKNTLVIFLSDNGPWLTQKQRGGSAGLLRDGKNSAFEGGMRVPAIAWWPDKIQSNSVCASLATAMDILPTLTYFSDSKLPGDRYFDGIDISEILLDTKEHVREVVYYYINTNLYAIRKGSWKAHFITHTSYSQEDPVVHETPLLFNIDIDPSEKYDVADQYPDILKEIIKEYKIQELILPVQSEIDKHLDY